MIWTAPRLAALATLMTAHRAAAALDPDVPSLDVPYKCDDITPDLCNLHVEEGSMKVLNFTLFYWIYSGNDATHSADDRFPLITVHGGPGFTHNYLLPLKQLACRGRKVVFYDQVGCGRSDRPTKQHAPWLYTKDYYVSELEKLIAHLGYANYHILGNSWGTVVSQLFAEKHPHSKGLKSVTLSGPLSNAKEYIEAQWDPTEGSIGKMPDFTQERIHYLESKQLYHSAEYTKISRILTAQFTVRTYPAPDCWMKALNDSNKEIYTDMQGASEFTIGGVLADLDITDQLVKINVPTLLTSGEYDTMRPPILRDMLAHLLNGYWIKIPLSGHVSMIDNPKVMNNELDRFLRSVEDEVSFTSELSLTFVKESAGKRSWNMLLAGTLIIGLVVGYLVGTRAPTSRNNRLLVVDGDLE
eukprot:GEMP01016024.1.p1 GENE.GEMP01016024.1~~GEMP01016024.1.p1  ORF type:complete len:413 (+),score=80.72 GEMP01016024.1:21-1259(+)